MQPQREITTRQSEIADLVHAERFASVEALAQRFEVTTQTIRRDVNRLCELGVLRRTHGGVETPASMDNVRYSARQILNLAEKRRIAADVAMHVPDRSSVALSIGTTPEIVMQALGQHTGLKIFTNNLNVAFAACGSESFDVTIVGGRLRHGDRDILGQETQDFFASYKVDIGIFGVAGVDEDGTLLDFDEDEVRARQSILANCRRSFLVLDHTKFSRPAHVRGGHIGEVSHIFTDAALPPHIGAQLHADQTVSIASLPERVAS